MNAFDHACAMVKNGLKSGTWCQGQRMPSLAKLARQCQVSRSTMWRAMAVLQKEALVHINRGGSIIAGPESTIPPDFVLRDCAWERLKTRIGQDIHSGILTEKKLPPINKLALQYRVAINTLKKALDQLVKEGLLKREGRGFCQITDQTRRHSQTITLISSGDPERGIIIAGDRRTEQIVSSFERECAHLGYSYRFEGFNHASANAILDLSNIIKGIGDEAGYIVNMWNPGNDLYWRRWLDVLQMLLDRGVPVVVIDQDGNLAFPKELYKRHNFRVLRIAGAKAGEAVGQALVRAGYQKVAYLMQSGTGDWERIRYAGLLKHYKQYGGPGTAVDLQILEPVAGDHRFHRMVLDFFKKEICNIFREQLSQEEMRGLTAVIEKSGILHTDRAIPANLLTKTVHLVTGFLQNLGGQEHDPWLYGHGLIELEYLASNTIRNLNLGPLFTKVLKASDATAWVCPNDQVAISALSFLRSQSVKVPGDISVFGFENLPEAREQHLSTYDFNMDGMVRKALLLIMDERSMKTSPPISEVEGYVVERRTTLRQ